MRVSRQDIKNILQFMILAIFGVLFICITTPNYPVQHVLAQIENSSTTLLSQAKTQPTSSAANSSSFNATSVFIIGNKTASAQLHRIPDDVTTGVEHAYERAQILYGPTSDKTRAAFSDKTVVECINDLFETRFSILNSTIEICDSSISQDLSLHLIDGSVQTSLGSGQYTTLNFQDLAKLYLQGRDIL